ncbi:uncharacterized protein LY89DRAFT_201335 [Mollisia scopiformis]|uniref:Uncharacterized protein n=1 Tax=Mollisia scopiformis TaxID=149040 RepID=A0A194WZQ0_MOLSC|nr:uncharacterized protein LY89DRAFT_201335 [Mollisia scopiformis]KUJ13097.1 hypothetical protein LY89DRAFT_201335 [Mollisia scopiformis]
MLCVTSAPTMNEITSTCKEFIQQSRNRNNRNITMDCSRILSTWNHHINKASFRKSIPIALHTANGFVLSLGHAETTARTSLQIRTRNRTEHQHQHHGRGPQDRYWGGPSRSGSARGVNDLKSENSGPTGSGRSDPSSNMSATCGCKSPHPEPHHFISNIHILRWKRGNLCDRKLKR